MDWYLEAADPETVTSLRREFHDYITRHAEPDQTAIDNALLGFAELTSNVWRHGGGAGWVTAAWNGDDLELVVRDLGPGFPPDLIPGARAPRAEGGLGLLLVSQLAKDLEIACRINGGSIVRARFVLPQRPPVHVAEPLRRRRTPSLPALSQAEPGGFPREPFLLAVAVEMATNLERLHGPRAADAVVAEVALGVSEQLEREYRSTVDAVGPLSSEQLADCLVRLKAAIGGAFHVLAIEPDRIVLGNTRCPFGDVVTRAPSLCAMTSGVFGGIVAASTGSSSVELAERIAIGDPMCRVTVWLTEQPGNPAAKHYRAET